MCFSFTSWHADQIKTRTNHYFLLYIIEKNDSRHCERRTLSWAYGGLGSIDFGTLNTSYGQVKKNVRYWPSNLIGNCIYNLFAGSPLPCNVVDCVSAWKGQVSVWRSATLLPTSCTSVPPVPARVEDSVIPQDNHLVVVPHTIHHFPECVKQASVYSAAGGEHDQ